MDRYAYATALARPVVDLGLREEITDWVGKMSSELTLRVWVELLPTILIRPPFRFMVLYAPKNKTLRLA